MQKVIELKNEFYSSWVSRNGLALLDANGQEPANGIYFYAVFMQLCRELDSVNTRDEQHAAFLLSMLEKEPGLLNRWPDTPVLDSHDNYIGGCSISKDFAQRCVKYGVEHGWNYNNVDGKWVKEAQRQGGEVAFYQLSAGYSADPFYLIWLCCGLLLAAFQWNSVVIAAWLRLRTIKGKNKFVDMTGVIFDLIVGIRGGILKFFKEYYRDTIYFRLAEVVYGK